ncbi:phospholipase D-like domain-containing protein [Natronorarus salvus]|uniref:phospholipase D-like domain-containing protein n=1 Tax=Natronorarus salvus TaxID=3117733 RepID=UPI002F26189F
MSRWSSSLVPVTVFAFVLVAIAIVAVGSIGTASGSGAPQIVEVYPNTAAEGNAGEHVVVSFPEPTDLNGWELADDRSTVPLGNGTAEGRVAFSTHPGYAAVFAEDPVHGLDGFIALSQEGDHIRLLYEGVVVDEVRYDRAPRAQRWVRLGPDSGPGHEEWRWIPERATGFEAESYEVEEATVFVLPDAPELPTEVLSSAEDRLLFAGYTVSSERAVGELLAAHDRGVEVVVLVDGTPVGGQTEHEAEALDRLADAGVEVRVFDGDRQRYRFHHAKYAVSDDRVLVLTENWKPSGTEGRSSRGWGVSVTDDAVAEDVVRVFEADSYGHDTVVWNEYREDREFVGSEPANATYPAEFRAKTLPADSVRVVAAPDNAEGETIAMLAGAEESIRVQQVSVGDTDHPFVEETMVAAERGVEVEYVLDGSWYVASENREFVRYVEERRTEDGLPVDARVVEPRSRFEKVHTKGVIVDDRRVLVSSVNWNNNSVRNNRELGLLVESEEVGGFYASVFRSDWYGGRWQLPVEFGAGVAISVGLAGWIGKRAIRFEG